MYSSRIKGSSSRQGTHQVAQKVINTGFPFSCDKETECPSMSVAVKFGAGLPTCTVPWGAGVGLLLSKCESNGVVTATTGKKSLKTVRLLEKISKPMPIRKTAATAFRTAYAPRTRASKRVSMPERPAAIRNG